MKTEARGGTIRFRLDTIASIVMIATCIFLVGRTFAERKPVRSDRPEIAVPPEPVSLGGAATKGSAAAPIGVMIFSDFECPFCRALARDVLPALEARYVTPGKVLLAFRHLPLTSIHPLAKDAAEAAECAKEQGVFWSLHDRLFATTEKPTQNSLRQFAADVGVGIAKYDACVGAGGSAQVDRDLAEARRLGITGTPTLLIGSREADGNLRVRAVEVGASLERIDGRIRAMLGS